MECVSWRRFLEMDDCLELVTREKPQMTDRKGMKSGWVHSPWEVCQSSARAVQSKRRLFLFFRIIKTLLTFSFKRLRRSLTSACCSFQHVKSTLLVFLHGCSVVTFCGSFSRVFSQFLKVVVNLPPSWMSMKLCLLNPFFKHWSENRVPRCKGDLGTVRAGGKETDERFLLLLQGTRGQFITEKMGGDPDRTSYEPDCHRSKISSWFTLLPISYSSSRHPTLPSSITLSIHSSFLLSSSLYVHPSISWYSHSVLTRAQRWVGAYIITVRGSLVELIFFDFICKRWKQMLHKFKVNWSSYLGFNLLILALSFYTKEFFSMFLCYLLAWFYLQLLIFQLFLSLLWHNTPHLFFSRDCQCHRPPLPLPPSCSPC